MSEESIRLDRGWDYDFELSIWVRCDKTRSEFEVSLESILDPIKISDGRFNLGNIPCELADVTGQPPSIDGIPDEPYQFKITVSTDGAIIWSYFSRHFALALAAGIRTKFLSSYLILNDQDTFVLYSGSHKPLYFNPNYESWKSGEFSAFRSSDAVELGT